MALRELTNNLGSNAVYTTLATSFGEILRRNHIHVRDVVVPLVVVCVSTLGVNLYKRGYTKIIEPRLEKKFPKYKKLMRA
jgi:hypothetical protein